MISTLTLSDYCDGFIIETNQIANELKLDAVLEGYQFFLETGSQLLLTDGKDNKDKNSSKSETKNNDQKSKERKQKFSEKVAKIKDRIIEALKRFIRNAMNILSRCKDKIIEKVEELKISSLKGKYLKSVDQFKSSYENWEQLIADNSKVSFNFPSGIENTVKNNAWFTKLIDSDIPPVDALVGIYVLKKEPSKEEIRIRMNDIDKFYKSGWNMNFIEKQKTAIEKDVKQEIKKLEMENIYNKSDLAMLYSDTMKYNANVITALMKVWIKYVAECFKTVKFIISKADNGGRIVSEEKIKKSEENTK